MKKFLLLILAISVIGGANAQNKKVGIKDLRTLSYKNPSPKNDVVDLPFIPFKPRNQYAKKALTSTPIGTSGNVYMCLNDAVNWLSYNPSLNAVSFVHRLGGPWGGTSGQLRVKYSTDFFATKDSVTYLPTSPNLFRYPSNVIYNPTGNTDLTNAFSVVCGPNTNGSGWINNFFGSQKLTNPSQNLDVQYFAQLADTNWLVLQNLTEGNGNFHTAATVSTVAAPSATLFYLIYNGIFNTANNVIDWAPDSILTLVKPRVFSNGNGAWSAHENVAFGDDGINGYFYSIGKDSLDNPGSVSSPMVWKTNDGGLNWTKYIYPYFSNIPEIQNYIYPTRLSYNNNPTDPTQWVYRANFPAGSTADEGDSPATVDKYGNLHIAAVVEGLWSIDPDSLDYGYLGQPLFLFDMIRTDTGWNAVFIDTLNTGVVDAANSGFGTGTDAQGWAHWVRMSRNADGSKVFVTWTDTDPLIDTTNIMPEVFAWGLDVDTKLMTVPTSFATGAGNIFYMMAADKVAQVGSTYKIPITYLDIYESGPNPLQPQKHYYLDGVQFDESDFSVISAIDKNEIAESTDAVSQSYPNPTNGKASFNVTIKDNATISVVVTNILGQVVYQTSKANSASGTHTFNLDTKNWNNGVYFYTVSTGKNKITKKMIVE